MPLIMYKAKFNKAKYLAKPICSRSFQIEESLDEEVKPENTETASGEEGQPNEENSTEENAEGVKNDDEESNQDKEKAIE